MNLRGFCVLTAGISVCVAVGVRGASTGPTALHTVQGINSGRSSGDFVSDNDAGALNGVYHYWVEVPPGVPNLTVDIFDADIGINTSGNEDTENRDRDRGGFNSTCAYSAFRPNATAITTNFTTGTNALPANSDNAWLAFFTVGGTTVLDQFGAAAYNNNNGTQNWAGNWIETNDDNNANGGNIRITGGELRIEDNNDASPSTIEREANLSTWSIASLSFTRRTTGVDANDVMLLQVSSNGGGAWTTIATYTGPQATAVTQSYNISTFRAANTRVRFIESANYGNNDFFFVDNLQIQDQVTAGHYEVRVDMGTDDDINAFGIRATSTDGTELNVYVDNIIPYGTNPDAGGATTRTYQLYPYVTSGCSCLHSDFDHDSSRTTLSHITYRTAANVLIADLADASLSDENLWGHQEITGWTTDQASTGYGVWDLDATIQSYGGTANGNYTDVLVGDYVRAAAYVANGTANPTASPEANAFRIYLPTDDSTAPVKPVLEQLLTQRFTGTLPANTQRRYTVTVRMDNRTAYPIAFSNALGNVVTARVPGTKVVYGGNFQMTQGTLISQPTVGAAAGGDVVWDPGTVTTTTTLTAASMSYDILVTVAPGDHIPVTGTAGSNGTRAKFIDETGNSTQTRATYTLGQVCELQVEQGLATPVLLSSFNAGVKGGGTNIEWITAAELGTIGFNVYRVDPAQNGALVKVNSRTIAAGPGAPQGARYRLVDRANLNASAAYYLEELTADGRKLRYGPYFASAKKTVQPPANGQLSDRLARGGASIGSVGIDDEGDPPVPNSVAAMVGVGRTGIVAVTAADIAANLNLPVATVLNAIASNGLKISNNGVPISWGSNATLDGVLFYGEKGDTIFSNERVYRIELGTGLPMSIVQVAGGAAPLTTFPGTRELETDAFAATVLPLDPNSDYWFWDYVLSGDPTDGRKTFSVNIPAVASTSGATLQVRLQGAQANTAHRARVWLNNAPVGELTWNGVDGKTADLAIPPALMTDGTNQLAVEGLLEPGVTFDVFYIDGFRVSYQKKAIPEASTLLLTAPAGGQVTAGPFASLPLVLDITDKTHPRMLQNGAFTGGNLSFAAPAGVQTMFISELVGFVAPAYVRGSAPATLLTSSGAEYIVITPGSLHAGAKALADYRASDGLKTLVVDLNQIYDELNGGNPNPAAIQAFISFTSRWRNKARYVVLIGTGTVDYRGIQGSPGPMPPMMFKTSDGLYASDSLYADRNFDNVPDLAIGRIPITTAEELNAYLQKLLNATRAQTATSKIIWSADGVDQGANFRLASLKAEAPMAGRPASRIYIDQLGSDAARTALLGAWQTGATLMNWVGHGGLDRLSTTSILTVDDVPSLATTGPLPVVTAMTCSINRFDIGVVDSLGAALTRAPNAGALAVWSSSGMSIHSDAAGLGRTFIRLAAKTPGSRIGDLIRQALSTTPSLGETGPLYLLLGDPAVRLALPAEPSAAPGTGVVTE